MDLISVHLNSSTVIVSRDFNLQGLDVRLDRIRRGKDTSVSVRTALRGSTSRPISPKSQVNLQYASRPTHSKPTTVVIVSKCKQAYHEIRMT